MYEHKHEYILTEHINNFPYNYEKIYAIVINNIPYYITEKNNA